jgi:two-component system chemotaxis response regulator CheY
MKTVMLVDDSLTMLMSLESILKRGGYAVDKNASGEEAEAKLSRGGVKPALIITDLNMGGMNGIELVKKVRAMREMRFTPILLLTTESQQARRAEARAAGATGWLVKPVPHDALLATVAQVVPA